MFPNLSLFGIRNKLRSLDVPAMMRQETITIPAVRGVDWKALGYIVSIVSVFFLGAIAWPQPSDPSWHLPALIIGMAA
jgi:hypothetical protein